MIHIIGKLPFLKKKRPISQAKATDLTVLLDRREVLYNVLECLALLVKGIRNNSNHSNIRIYFKKADRLLYRDVVSRCFYYINKAWMPSNGFLEQICLCIRFVMPVDCLRIAAIVESTYWSNFSFF